MRHVTRHMLVVTVAVAILTPAPARSQGLGLLNGLGYAAAGGAIGVAASANSGCSGDGWCIVPDAMIPAMLGGVLAGVVTGVAINSSAERKVDHGEPLSGAHLAALSVGAVLGGAALGAVAGAVLIKPQGSGTFLGSDERTLALMSAAGAGLGVFRLHQHWKALTGRSVDVRPAVLHGGQPGIVASIHF